MVGRRSKYTKILLTKSYSNTNLKLDGITQLDRLVFNFYVKQVRQINKFLNIIYMFVIYIVYEKITYEDAIFNS
jgi:hypothetical protein